MCQEQEVHTQCQPFALHEVIVKEYLQKAKGWRALGFPQTDRQTDKQPTQPWQAGPPELIVFACKHFLHALSKLILPGISHNSLHHCWGEPGKISLYFKRKY